MKQSPLKATIWSFIERFSSQFVGILIGMILARLLSPQDYGIVGLTTIFITISNVFIDSGFGNGLIRKEHRTEEDLSTAFYFNIIVGFFAYSMLYVFSPLIARFFYEPELLLLIKIVGLNVIFNSLSIVQTAILTANLNIRLQTIINICSQIPAGLVAIYLAYCGFGIYALAWQAVSASFIKVLLLWRMTKWKPMLIFSVASFKYLWSFGSKLLGANLIGTAFNEIYSVLIGKYIGKQDLGYYSKSNHLNASVDSISTGIIQKISLPILSKYQSEKDMLADKYRFIMRLLVMFMAPIIAILCVTSKDIIIILWSEKWIQCAVIFQLLVIGTIFNPISNLSLSLLQSVGRSDLILKLEIPKKIIYSLYIALGFYFGILGLVVARILINLTAALINMWATKKVLNYSYMHQLGDIFKYILIIIVLSGISVIMVDSFNPIMNILMHTMVISFMYILLLYSINDITYYQLLSKVRDYFKMSKGNI